MFRAAKYSRSRRIFTVPLWIQFEELLANDPRDAAAVVSVLEVSIREIWDRKAVIPAI
jgi:hypothetical protein